MHIYAGTFLIGFATLAFEVALTRLLSVITWYHLAFYAVSTAMLGMTAGATKVYFTPAWSARDGLEENVSAACRRFARIVPASVILLCLLPIGIGSWSMRLVAFLVATVACALPFYYAGIALTLVLTRYPGSVARIYAADLFGASLGCLFVLGGLEVADAVSLILLCGALGALAACAFAWTLPSPRRRALWTFAVLAVVGCVNMHPSAIRPTFMKGQEHGAGSYVLERWNSFSRVVVHAAERAQPRLWGASPVMPPDDEIVQHQMTIDGAAGTLLRRYATREDIDDLQYDVTNIAYYLRPRGGACVIGVGGGRDVLSALYFGHERVTGVEVNPIFIDLHEKMFREFSGIADTPGVELVVDEARSYLSRSQDHFAVVQMSLIDTWAATGAGAFSLSENALYTVEAWSTFLERLQDDGIFTVSRWFNRDDVGETGRALSLAVATLLRRGVSEPSRHIAMITGDRVSTLLVSRMPFRAEDIARLREVAQRLQFQPVVVPDAPPQHELLRRIVMARSQKEILEVTAGAEMNFEPPTDENPYFFNMLRLSNLRAAARARSGVMQGNLQATLTLVALIASLLGVAAAMIVLPVAQQMRASRKAAAARPGFGAGLAYFSLIGAGFMAVEIGLLQRLSVLLGHPTYALGILLFGIIWSTGAGSYFSERIDPRRSVWMLAYPLLTAATVLVVRFLLSAVMSTAITAPIGWRIAVAVAVIFPLGFLMGAFFPSGMRLAKEVANDEAPWFWALNGVFGVLFSALAVFFGIYFGIATNFYIGAVAYALLTPCLLRMRAAAA